MYIPCLKANNIMWVRRTKFIAKKNHVSTISLFRVGFHSLRRQPSRVLRPWCSGVKLVSLSYRTRIPLVVRGSLALRRVSFRSASDEGRQHRGQRNLLGARQSVAVRCRMQVYHLFRTHGKVRECRRTMTSLCGQA